ncbi:tetratricopeptide repeat protein [Arenibacter sp. N53]|uniref:tetratricopeptide repeat-containing sensor histidine kinase n=1 Tax=Arenibacter TaxID=178469 RepID=UPI000CD3CB8C|nr:MULTISPECIES: histidine kinase [Arenibacter]MCM4154327.1 tetratricopeptide repeat protein [Arenibacter sp. N53]
MTKYFCICFLMLFGGSIGYAQISQTGEQFEVQGIVKEKKSNQGISGVAVSTESGEYSLTNARGKFIIKVTMGEEVLFASPDMETVRYLVKNKNDIEILVDSFKTGEIGASKSRTADRSVFLYRSYIDSANFYKKKDIRRSIDFITQSISHLGVGNNKEELAISYTTLGEVYQYHKQYDLAISSYKDALLANNTLKTSLLLGQSYILNKDYVAAEKILSPLVKIPKMVPYQRVELYESLGDAYGGLGDVDKAVAFYNEGLTVAEKNQISPKTIDLNSKIAGAYAKVNRIHEADVYFNNSLKMASEQAPQRSVQEKEKVADFYNQKNQFGQEIALRKKSLEDLKKIPKTKSPVAGTLNQNDTITAQRINYKIANAYIAQDKYEEAIPYLEESIKDADLDDDLFVQKDATRKLSEVYKYKGDFTKALETYQQYVAVVDTLYVRKEQEIARAARFNREIASKQSRISGLEQERELSQSKYSLALTEQQLVEESIKRQNWIIYSLIFGMLLMALATYFFYRSNKQQKLANNLLALKSLRSQMNPHFIFNALNSVNNFIAKSDERSANRYLSDFSTLMRAVLENSDEDFIPLSKELELLELYTKLEHSRFTDKFDYKIVIDSNIDIDAFQIPPMLLQPYIENAIWHGLRYREDKGFLKIELNQKDKNALEISITDNGIGRKKSTAIKTQNQKKQKSKGMGNIKKRIEILNDMYKDKVDVFISDLEANGTGTKVRFTIKRD